MTEKLITENLIFYILYNYNVIYYKTIYNNIFKSNEEFVNSLNYFFTIMYLFY